jgi:Fe2+ or Zn2+ uptake regulation protein
LGLAVASGTLAFGSIPVKQGDVLYLALEDTERRLQSRLSKLLAPGESVPEHFDYATQWPKMDAYGLSLLEEWIKAHPNARLIIIDPWVKVRPPMAQRAGMTGYDYDYESLEGLKRLSDTYHVCILVQFHLRKAAAEDPFDELNGTTAITACADGFLSLKRARKEVQATLYATGRDYEQEVDLALSFANGCWNILGQAKEVAISRERKEVLELLNQAGSPLFPRDIAKALQKPGDAIRQLLRSMREDDLIEEAANGGYVAKWNHSDHGDHSASIDHGQIVSTEEKISPAQEEQAVPPEQETVMSVIPVIAVIQSEAPEYPDVMIEEMVPAPTRACFHCQTQNWWPYWKEEKAAWGCGTCHPEIKESQGKLYYS